MLYKRGPASMRIGTLQWVFGGVCAVIGALMLIAPHQFAAATFAHLQAHLPWWGAAFSILGLALLAVPVLAPPRSVGIAIHLAVALGYLVFAAGFVLTSSWTATGIYTTLGLSIAMAACWVGRPTPPHAR